MNDEEIIGQAKKRNIVRVPIWQEGKLVWLDDTQFSENYDHLEELSYTDFLDYIKSLESKLMKSIQDLCDLTKYMQQLSKENRELIEERDKLLCLKKNP